MARYLKHGLVLFDRKRIGLHAPRGNYLGQPAIKGVSIHHGGPVGGPRMTFAAAQATWKSWQDFHMFDADHGWNDIGYNLGVDGLGRLYEGRPMWAVPAAVENHNTGYPGINFMQDGRSHGLTVLQRRTLKVLFQHGIPELGLKPLKHLDVRGHREFSGHETNECPGDLIMRHLRWRRSR